MRVLHLDTGKTLRGGQHQLLALLRAQQSNLEPRLLAPAASPTLEAASALGIPASPISLASVFTASATANLVHCHDARSHTLAAIASRAPFVVSRRVVFEIKRGLLSRWKYARPAHYLCISNAVLCKLLAAGIPEARLSIAGDGVDLPATLSDRSGPILALQSDDPLKGNDLLRQAHVNAHFTKDLTGLLPQARLFIYISESEGLGSAALLAMAHGVPVIASRTGGLPEIVIDGRTGLLVRNVPSEISEAVHRISSDEALAASLAAQGRALVERRFTTAHMAEATLAAYRKVLA